VRRSPLLTTFVCIVTAAIFAAAAPMGHAVAVGKVGTTAAKCSSATYQAERRIPVFRQGPHLIFTRHLNVGPHTVKKDVTWSVGATATLTAHVSKSGGARGRSGWIWRRVASHFAQRVASGGEHTPLTATSGGTFAVRNHTSRAKHDIEFNGMTRFFGRYFTTRCADPNTQGVGHVVRRNGTWATFSKVDDVGIVQCGAGSGGSATAKAALKHCK
jgi:hypothetical protein